MPAQLETDQSRFEQSGGATSTQRNNTLVLSSVCSAEPIKRNPPVSIRAGWISTHLTLVKFLRKISDGQIPLPLVRIETSQKSAKGVHLQDLADYLDARRKVAQREYQQMYG